MNTKPTKQTSFVKICSDGLDKQIEEYLELGKRRRRQMWLNDGEFIDGTRLFGYCGDGYNDISNIGCPIMVKSGKYVACTPKITRMIRRSNLPKSNYCTDTALVSLTRGQLKRIKTIQLAVYEAMSKNKKTSTF